MSYSENDHKHNFAVWAGARAAQRGFTNVEMLKEALEQCNVMSYVNDLPTGKTQNDFDSLHKEWCLSICDFLEEKGIQNVSYGRAAKLIAVYLKSMTVLPDLNGEHAKYIHPPIDRILLQNLSKKNGLETNTKKILKETAWTKLDESAYFDIIEILKELNGSNPFWKLEKYWTVTND